MVWWWWFWISGSSSQRKWVVSFHFVSCTAHSERKTTSNTCWHRNHCDNVMNVRVFVLCCDVMWCGMVWGRQWKLKRCVKAYALIIISFFLLHQFPLQFTFHESVPLPILNRFIYIQIDWVQSIFIQRMTCKQLPSTKSTVSTFLFIFLVSIYIYICIWYLFGESHFFFLSIVMYKMICCASFEEKLYIRCPLYRRNNECKKTTINLILKWCQFQCHQKHQANTTTFNFGL